MNVLVFGGDGFLGSHFVEYLASLDAGHKIAIFDRFQNNVTRNLEHLRKNIQIYSGEFANREDILRSLEGIDIVYHCISVTNPVSSWNDPFIEVDENIRNSVQLFEIAAQQGVKKMVFLSSGGTIYGRQEGVIHENTLPMPFSPYGIGKLTIEHFLNYYQHTGRLIADIYRVGNAFGPRQPMHCPQGVISKWMDCIMNGRKVLVYGDSTTIRDYIYVGDVARLIGQSIDFPDVSGTYNVGSGQGVAITELLEIFKRVVDHHFSYSFMPRREFDNVSVILDSDCLLKQCPGFVFSNFEEKLRETWQYVRFYNGQRK